MLGDELARPEQVDAIVRTCEPFYRCLERGDMPTLLAKDLKELVPEGLGLGVFSRFVFPLTSEVDRPLTDFVPAQRHVRMVTSGAVGCAGFKNEKGPAQVYLNGPNSGDDLLSRYAVSSAARA